MHLIFCLCWHALVLLHKTCWKPVNSLIFCQETLNAKQGKTIMTWQFIRKGLILQGAENGCQQEQEGAWQAAGLIPCTFAALPLLWLDAQLPKWRKLQSRECMAKWWPWFCPLQVAPHVPLAGSAIVGSAGLMFQSTKGKNGDSLIHCQREANSTSPLLPWQIKPQQWKFQTVCNG